MGNKSLWWNTFFKIWIGFSLITLVIIIWLASARDVNETMLGLLLPLITLIGMFVLCFPASIAGIFIFLGVFGWLSGRLSEFLGEEYMYPTSYRGKHHELQLIELAIWISFFIPGLMQWYYIVRLKTKKQL